MLSLKKTGPKLPTKHDLLGINSKGRKHCRYSMQAEYLKMNQRSTHHAYTMDSGNVTPRIVVGSNIPETSTAVSKKEELTMTEDVPPFVRNKIEEILNDIKPQFELLLQSQRRNYATTLIMLKERISSENLILLDLELDYLTRKCLQRDSFASNEGEKMFWNENPAYHFLMNKEFVYTPPKALSSKKVKRFLSNKTIRNSSKGIWTKKILNLMFYYSVCFSASITPYLISIFFNKTIRSIYVDQMIKELRSELLNWHSSIEKEFEKEINKFATEP